MADRPILTWEDGSPVKFFIQKDLGPEVIEGLTRQITQHGGTTMAKVPRQGFVLVDPESAEGIRLIQCWDTEDHPKRSFVPCIFVQASIDAGKLIPQVFRRQGTRIKIHIHESVKDTGTIRTIQRAVWLSGGDPTATHAEADVIILDELSPAFPELVQQYEHSRKKFVEDITWVNQCVDSGEFRTTPHVKRNLGGRIPGAKRTEFNETDDNHLISYIARRLPDPTMRGRTGNKLYQDLCNRPDLYPWSARHPWQSWRERFKNNSNRFTRRIADYVRENPIAPEDNKGLHGFVRASTSKGGVAHPPPPPSQSQSQPASQPAGPAITQAEDRQEEDHDDGWGSQWEVKLGNEPTPSWAAKGKGKRKESERSSQSGSPSKRRRVDGNESSSSQESKNAVEDNLDPQIATPALSQVAGPSGSPSKQAISAIPATSQGTSESPSKQSQPNDAPRSNGKGKGKEVVANLFGSDTQSDEGEDDEDIGSQTQALLNANREFISQPSFAGPTQSPPQPPPQSQSQQSQSQPQSQSRSHSQSLPQSQPVSQSQSQSQRQSQSQSHPPPPSPLKDRNIDVALAQIACQYGFLLSEVAQEYEDVGDIEATRAFFKHAREYMEEMKRARITRTAAG
ncbi:hypothetical protein M422DRAFT_29722 [Sphaerobolus stellatus SS14]|uniref:TERF2-interacting telomeric protein 1 Myb domain-containing protein n=1 Tax=Sphaerobolus stellatus (strain SS14) TaxID=990650 RepID=A0A0C9W1Z4_SPHS4|nr:hypothetical protein M422DRAFT_29722 [Sphaerobolus stellatus SS14]